MPIFAPYFVQVVGGDMPRPLERDEFAAVAAAVLPWFPDAVQVEIDPVRCTVCVGLRMERHQDVAAFEKRARAFTLWWWADGGKKGLALRQVLVTNFAPPPGRVGG